MTDITFIQKISFVLALALVVYFVYLCRFRGRR